MDREFILAEIKRTAAANGGRALGRARFLQETGIKEADWLGRYWVRWSEAVREAGFEPNRFVIGYGEAELLERYIGLARELGHFPVKAELVMKAREDRTFPNEKTFGARPKLVAKLLAYCRLRPGHEDIVRLCEEVAPPARPEKTGREASVEFGFVYLIRSGGYYKIGRSNAVGRRERELAIQLPEKANTVHVIRTDDPAGIEEYWHKRFGAKRKNGEWFDLSAADVSAFSRRKFM